MQPPLPIAEHYSRLTDGELQQLAGELATLTSDAQSALRDELRFRSLPFDQTDKEAAEPRTPPQTPQKILALRDLSFWLGHSVLSSLGVGVVVAIFFYSVKAPLEVVAPSLATHNALLIIPLFPVQTLTGLLNGFLAARTKAGFWRSRSAELAWIVPALWLAFLFHNNYSPAGFPVFPETRWQHFFWSSIPRIRGLQLASTMPFLASVAYSGGHLVSRKLQSRIELRGATASCL